jgi:hypothetical protein
MEVPLERSMLIARKYHGLKENMSAKAPSDCKRNPPRTTPLKPSRVPLTKRLHRIGPKNVEMPKKVYNTPNEVLPLSPKS